VLGANQTLTGTGVTAGTTIVQQLTGTTGGPGTYQVSVSQSVGTSTAGVTMTANNPVTLNGSSFTGEGVDECQQGIAAARAAAATGTWVYSVAYGSSSSGCSSDTSVIVSGLSNVPSPCQTMYEIANSKGVTPDENKFYQDGSCGSLGLAGNSITSLVSLFESLSAQFSEPRLLPNNIS
jgi:hypothetical protein